MSDNWIKEHAEFTAKQIYQQLKENNFQLDEDISTIAAQQRIQARKSSRNISDKAPFSWKGLMNKFSGKPDNVKKTYNPDVEQAKVNQIRQSKKTQDDVFKSRTINRLFSKPELDPNRTKQSLNPPGVDPALGWNDVSPTSKKSTNINSTLNDVADTAAKASNKTTNAPTGLAVAGRSNNNAGAGGPPVQQTAPLGDPSQDKSNVENKQKPVKQYPKSGNDEMTGSEWGNRPNTTTSSSAPVQTTNTQNNRPPAPTTPITSQSGRSEPAAKPIPNATTAPTSRPRVQGNIGGKGGTAGAVGADNASDYVYPGQKGSAQFYRDNDRRGWLGENELFDDATKKVKKKLEKKGKDKGEKYVSKLCSVIVNPEKPELTSFYENQEK